VASVASTRLRRPRNSSTSNSSSSSDSSSSISLNLLYTSVFLFTVAHYFSLHILCQFRGSVLSWVLFRLPSASRQKSLSLLLIVADVRSSYHSWLLAPVFVYVTTWAPGFLFSFLTSSTRPFSRLTIIKYLDVPPTTNHHLCSRSCKSPLCMRDIMWHVPLCKNKYTFEFPTPHCLFTMT